MVGGLGGWRGAEEGSADGSVSASFVTVAFSESLSLRVGTHRDQRDSRRPTRTFTKRTGNSSNRTYNPSTTMYVLLPILFFHL